MSGGFRGVRISLPAIGFAVLAFAAGGCTDRATPTSVTRPTFAAANGRGVGLRLISNAVPYAVGGIRPATGRSGFAAISATAVINGASAVLTVTSFAASDADFSDPFGNIFKLQIKAYDPSGHLLFVDNQNNLAPASYIRSFTYAGLPPGATFVVQANVKDIAPKRTDVVTLPAVIVAKPVDLSVLSLNVPATAVVNVDVPITVMVQELNGDQNARASVVLNVQDVPVQTIQNVYVAAGGTVSCVFAYAFPSAGTYGVRVALQSVVPTDANPANNSSLNGTTAINSQSGPGGSAPPPADQLTYASRAGRDQFSEVFGQYYGGLTFPLDELTLRQGLKSSATSPGMDVVMHEFVGAKLAQNSSGSVPCFSGTDQQLGVFYSLCQYQDGLTRLTYVRGLANVTYVSQRFNFKLLGSASCASQPGVAVASDAAAVADGLPCYIVTSAAGSTSGPATWGGYQSLVLSVHLGTGGVLFDAAVEIPLIASSLADQLINGLQPFSVQSAGCFPGLGCTVNPTATWVFMKHRYSEVGIYAAAKSGEFSGVPVTTP